VFLSHVEVDALADAAGSYRPMILTLAYTGVRFGEAAALRVSSVDVMTRRITIAQAWAGLTTGAPYLSTPKNRKQRKVGLPTFLIRELADLLDGRAASAWLFTAPRGGVLDLPNWNRRVFAPAARRAGLAGRGLTPHSLRHTAASLAIAAGADVKVVQTMLGHKDAAMTLNVYAGLFPDRLGVVADALEAARAAALGSTN
jgi:integrase